MPPSSHTVQRILPAAALALGCAADLTAFAMASTPSATRRMGAFGKRASSESAFMPLMSRSSIVRASMSAAPSSMQ
jgi:hypothetical protein